MLEHVHRVFHLAPNLLHQPVLVPDDEHRRMVLLLLLFRVVIESLGAGDGDRPFL